jgi:hypothetical protein
MKLNKSTNSKLPSNCNVIPLPVAATCTYSASCIPVQASILPTPHNYESQSKIINELEHLKIRFNKFEHAFTSFTNSIVHYENQGNFHPISS